MIKKRWNCILIEKIYYWNNLQKYLLQKEMREEILLDFEECDFLCAYNAVLFDIPFMQYVLQIPPETVVQKILFFFVYLKCVKFKKNCTFVQETWLRKLCDPFHAIKTAFLFTSKLNHMLAMNNLQSKSASGADAITFVKEVSFYFFKFFHFFDFSKLSFWFFKTFNRRNGMNWLHIVWYCNHPDFEHSWKIFTDCNLTGWCASDFATLSSWRNQTFQK